MDIARDSVPPYNKLAAHLDDSTTEHAAVCMSGLRISDLLWRQ